MRLVFPLLAAMFVGCASTIDGTGGPDGSAGNGADGGRRDAAADARDVPYFDTNAYDVYREDACPGARPPAQRAYECDPLAGGGCPPGTGCYAFIEYPPV